MDESINGTSRLGAHTSGATVESAHVRNVFFWRVLFFVLAHTRRIAKISVFQSLMDNVSKRFVFPYPKSASLSYVYMCIGSK